MLPENYIDFVSQICRLYGYTTFWLYPRGLQEQCKASTSSTTKRLEPE